MVIDDILGMVFGGSVTVLFSIGMVRGTVPTIRAMRKGATAQGTIVSSRAQTTRYHTIYHPIVEFATADGQRVEYQDAMAVPEDFQIGDVVTVHYDPSRPKLSATSADRDQAMTVAITMVCLTLFFAGIFVVSLLLLLGVVR
ncbi:MAG TPA: DUF3592 domain-containing protein [Pseudonocardiaceae bacterium]|jgi:hypothetical protein|nr:DUF3592 domain-containing protein [Pseudonocardiaceae bacterium]